MRSIDEVKSILEENKKHIAFIIGNGVNRYSNNTSLSWEKLLTNLWNSTQDSIIENIPQGVTYTEFYDILQVNCTKKSQERRDNYYNEVLKWIKEKQRVSFNPNGLKFNSPLYDESPINKLNLKQFYSNFNSILSINSIVISK